MKANYKANEILKNEEKKKISVIKIWRLKNAEGQMGRIFLQDKTKICRFDSPAVFAKTVSRIIPVKFGPNCHSGLGRDVNWLSEHSVLR